MANLFTMGQGTYANYAALTSKSKYEVYFTNDTHQIFVGADEYTKGTKTLTAVPTAATAGDQDRLYFYNGALYLCEGGTAGNYKWTRVANINDVAGTVTSVAAGEGLETADGSAITAEGTIKHAVPSGAAATADDVVDQTPKFGETFNIKGIATDKFGHVTGINAHSVTIPTETPVTVAAGSTSASTIKEGGSFTVITGVSRSAGASATDHDLVYDTTTFTIEADEEVTYTVSSTTEGVITLTGSDASTSTAKINGWDDLAKKSDITTVFRYKGSVENVSDLPTADVQVGDVYNVKNGSAQGTASEYVATVASPNVAWEELGTTIDLSAYATIEYVDQKLTWHEF